MLRGRWLKWLVIAGVWQLASLVFVGFQYFTVKGVSQTAAMRSATQAASSSAGIDWLVVLKWNLFSFLIWTLLTPLIIELVRRFRIERRRWAASLLFHLPASVAVSAFQIGSFVAAVWAFKGPRSENYASFSALFGYYFFRNLSFELLIYWIVVLLVHAIDYYRKYREEELIASQLRGQLAQAQLQALKMQLHPHFLFNTLNGITELIHQDPDCAEQILTQLSDMLRISLDKVGVQEVSLKQELEFLKKYLEIEQSRFRERLRVEMQIDPQALDACVPNMILQPLVENAVRYGVAPRARGGRISIHAARTNGMLHVTVSDDGRGLAEGLEKLATKSGVGLSNTQARLECLYGAAHRFELESTPGRGLTVRLAIPFRENHTEATTDEHHQGVDR